LISRIEAYRIRATELNIGMPEAGGIAFATCYVHGVPVNVTARANNAYDAINALWHALDLAHKALPMEFEKPLPPQAPPPAKSAPNEPVYTNVADPFSDNPEVPPPPTGKEYIVFDADKLVILPQPDEKVTLEFYAGSDKYPKVKVNKWPWEGATGLLRHVTSADVAKPATLTLKCRVYYTLGKQFTLDNGKTGNYKDVHHIRPL
jgi:hypothetical protein